jgi:hypothetical protein
MQVAAGPHGWRGLEQAAFWQALIEQVAGTTQKHEWVTAHSLVLELQPLQITSSIELQNFLYYIHFRASPAALSPQMNILGLRFSPHFPFTTPMTSYIFVSVAMAILLVMLVLGYIENTRDYLSRKI